MALSVTKRNQLLRRKAKLEEQIETWRADLEAMDDMSLDSRANVVIDVRRATDHYARILRRLERNDR